MSMGDPRVEKYMGPISAILDSVRDRLDHNDRTAIYNRTYEAVWKAIRDMEKPTPNLKYMGQR